MPNPGTPLSHVIPKPIEIRLLFSVICLYITLPGYIIDGCVLYVVI